MLPETPSPVLPARSIALVIDDAPETLGLISSALEENGMTVLVARSGIEGIELARRVRPDVILLDALMPGMDGFETCRILKGGPSPEPAPVIFMTGLTESEHILKGLGAGGVDYITKPVVVDELIARIITHVLNARAIASARSALEHAGQSVLAFARDGRLAWGSPGALGLLETEAGRALVPRGRAAAGLAAWLAGLVEQPISAARPYEAEGYILKYLGQGPGETMVRIRRQQEGGCEARLAGSFGLTDREAEVLFWLTRGKTNRDIAEILELSARTVNKHLEQVFHKMGVDNRTSAAVIADRMLNH
ncbi:DNA-binding response regulator [Rhodovulum euryhalinum]|uniref:LuxR family two component transcriptional regulator n=1 Tax=Rhodovulum euryhalinum TaxID=35805 RepID=A0A4R2KD73_9RHOB|nr:DNA-binding response regulator [Rhodovulum euryhalinum]TCO70077.1 LuxR family two component transcriptional regulator [Rhodovulum euryhalinum]